MTITEADLRSMQELAQRVTAIRQDLLGADASYGELAWNWGRDHARVGASWQRELWFEQGEPVAWAWARGGYLAYLVHPERAELVDAVIAWFEAAAPGRERTVLPSGADESGLARWAAHGYRPDLDVLGDNGSWTMLNQRDLLDVPEPLLPDGFRFRTAAEAGPAAVVRAHLNAWPRSTYSVEGYAGLRRTPGYRGDLHLLVEAPDGRMACSTILWLDERNRTAEFEPVGTHPDFRRQGLARQMLWHGMRLVRAAGAAQVTVACVGAARRPAARGLFHGAGFRELCRDAPLIRPAG